MQCPKCSIEMDEVRKLDVIIDSCSKCGGKHGEGRKKKKGGFMDILGSFGRED
ncbi:MAG: zf-TFIIB domain-containing protein [Thermoleophilia bacterium]